MNLMEKARVWMWLRSGNQKKRGHGYALSAKDAATENEPTGPGSAGGSVDPFDDVHLGRWNQHQLGYGIELESKQWLPCLARMTQ